MSLDLSQAVAVRRAAREAKQEAANRLQRVAEIREAIEAAAEEETAAYPQYRGYWSTERWQLGSVTRLIRTRLGVAFRTGDVVLYRVREAQEIEASGGAGFVVAYSIRNGIDTSVEEEVVEALATETSYRHPLGLVTLTG